MFRISRSIPLLETRGLHGCKPSPLYQTLNRLGIGESFFMKDKTIETVGRRIRKWRTKYARTETFACRAVGDGVRIWRIS